MPRSLGSVPPDLVTNLRRGLAAGVVTGAGDAVGVVEEPPAVLGAGAGAGAGDKGTFAVPGIAAGDKGVALFTCWGLVNTGADDLLGADELATLLPPGSGVVIVPAYSLTAPPRDRLIASSSICCHAQRSARPPPPAQPPRRDQPHTLAHNRRRLLFTIYFEEAICR